MEYRHLGGSGLKVPVLAFGTATFGGATEFFSNWGNTPVEETLRTLDDLVHSGKVRYIACSNFSGWHLMKSLAVSEKYGLERYVAHQAYYSLVGRDYEWELMPLALDQKVGTVVWSPLGWGRLTGRIRRGQPMPETTRLQSKLAL